VAGIEEADGEAARELAAEQAVDAALRFARRRRIGPFASQSPDRAARDKALAAMIRAGHGFELAKAVVDMPPGTEIDLNELRSETS
jgi:regulatory protein